LEGLPGPRAGPSCLYCGFIFPPLVAPPSGRCAPPPARPVTHCVICGSGEFYVQKDFNRRLGLAIVVLTALVAFVVMVLAGHLWGFLVLGAATLADLVAYRFLPEVCICYLCQSVYRGFPANPEHRGFYLANDERFKALRQAWLSELKL